MDTPTVYSLSKLNEGIKGVIARNTHVVWIWAEVHTKNVNSISGHCYIDLIEKDGDNAQIIAKQTATIWAAKYRTIARKFFDATGQNITVGMKIQLQVQVEFHPVFGLYLNILDIDPTYTLGDMFRQRKLLIEKLRKSGLFDRNKSLSLPLLPQRIAVISSSGAAGYNDFVDQLLKNKYGFAYSLTLFDARMQGDGADRSIVDALDAVSRSATRFDLAVIIRGGGALSDLAAFDSELLAVACANFTLPILTGIGHQRDESILDMVAHTALKTPTAVAEFIISLTLSVATMCDNLQMRLADSVNRRLKSENDALIHLSRNLPYRVSNLLSGYYVRLEQFSKDLRSSVDFMITRCERQLEREASNLHYQAMNRLSGEKLRTDRLNTKLIMSTQALISNHSANLKIMGTKIELLDSRRILRQGYSITTYNGKPLTSATEVKSGDKIVTILADGTVESIIEK